LLLQAHMIGVQNLLKYYSTRTGSLSSSGAADSSKPPQAHSFKEFLNDQAKREAIEKQKPILGRGQQDGIVSLCSPQKKTARQVAADLAKRKAITLIRAKGGIERVDPNGSSASVRKRLHGAVGSNRQEEKSPAEGSACPDLVDSSAASLGNISKENNVDRSVLSKKTFSNDELRAMLNKKSTHENELHQDDMARETSYFNTMEQKEKVETYVTQTMEIKNCDVLTCKKVRSIMYSLPELLKVIKCQYTWHRQSDFCLSQGHAVMRHKANRRYFRCRTCAKRIICYELLPVKPCIVCSCFFLFSGHSWTNISYAALILMRLVHGPQCGENNFERVAMRDERKVKLPRQELLIRGEERKFVNS
uniref:Mcm10 domain-containing protein n=1 Tax=Toxocara canis TaxID=6265 RepID=A0A183TW37_TOXCA